jgi:hypothetical protein
MFIIFKHIFIYRLQLSSDYYNFFELSVISDVRYNRVSYNEVLL